MRRCIPGKGRHVLKSVSLEARNLEHVFHLNDVLMVNVGAVQAIASRALEK